MRWYIHRRKLNMRRYENNVRWWYGPWVVTSSENGNPIDFESWQEAISYVERKIMSYARGEK
jgi:hypothetical protein